MSSANKLPLTNASFKSSATILDIPQTAAQGTDEAEELLAKILTVLRGGGVSSANSGPTGTNQFNSSTVGATPVSVKGSAGRIYAVSVQNLHSSAIFLKVYDLAVGSTNPATSVPKNTFMVAPNGSISLRGVDLPWAYQNAITIIVSTVAANGTAQSSPATLPIVEIEWT